MSASGALPPGALQEDVRARIEAAFRDAGVTGFLHATDIRTGREFAVRADEPVALAAVFKVPLLVTFYRQVADGLLDPTEPVALAPGATLPGTDGGVRAPGRGAHVPARPRLPHDHRQRQHRR